jgi:peptidyl-prolyl cis-trans isomerase C
MAEEDVGSQLQGSPEQKREALVGYLTDVLLVSQAAEKQKVADSPEFKRREAFMRNKLLMGALLQSNAKAAASDEEMHKVYDDAVKPMGAEEEVRARHILVETEDEAKAIAQEIKGGADFAEVAKEKSKDPGSAKDGGDLGYFVKGNMVPEFADVAFKMYPGQVSNPVKSQFGWHIIKLEDKRSRQVPKFDDVKNQIEAFVARRAQTEFVAQLREGAKIERLDKPGTPPPPVSVLPPAEAPAPAEEPLTPTAEPPSTPK